MKEFIEQQNKHFQEILAKEFKDFDPSPFEVIEIKDSGKEYIHPGYSVDLTGQGAVMRYKPEGTRLHDYSENYLIASEHVPGTCGVPSFGIMATITDDQFWSDAEEAMKSLSSACRNTYKVHMSRVAEIASPGDKLQLIVRLWYHYNIWENFEYRGISLSVYSRFLPFIAKEKL